MSELNEYWSAQAVSEYRQYLYDKKMMDYSEACLRQSPSVIYPTKVAKDGNMYCCLYGDNLQSGIAGFGETPEKACSEFDRVWREGER